MKLKAKTEAVVNLEIKHAASVYLPPVFEPILREHMENHEFSKKFFSNHNKTL